MSISSEPIMTSDQMILPFKVGFHINNGPTFNEVEVGDLGNVRAEKTGENDEGLPQYNVPTSDIVRQLIIATDALIHQGGAFEGDDHIEDRYYLRGLAMYLYGRIPE